MEEGTKAGSVRSRALTELEAKRHIMKTYLQSKVDSEDFHAVADAAMDLREIDAAIGVLRRILDIFPAEAL